MLSSRPHPRNIRNLNNQMELNDHSTNFLSVKKLCPFANSSIAAAVSPKQIKIAVNLDE